MTRRIVHTPDTCAGAPRIDGTRLTCANVVLGVVSDGSVAAYLRTYDYLTRDDVRVALNYCRAKRCTTDGVGNYCTGCSLDLRPDIRPSVFLDSEKELRSHAESCAEGGPPGQAFLGSVEDYEADLEPGDVWRDAREILEKEEGE